GRARSPKRAKIDNASVRRFETVGEYSRFTERWMRPAVACLSADGHAVIWTNLLGRDPILEVATREGLVHHGTFLWAKLGKAGNSGEKLARLYEVALIFGRHPRPEPAPEDRLPPRHFVSGYDVEGAASQWEGHPNHKPFSLLEPLLRWYSAPGDVVLEPFSGSGSTAAAAVRLGRTARALEIRAQWARVSGERLQAVVAAQQAAENRGRSPSSEA
ncbi:MAG: site-specific DNA-methyltransferase, partial [Deltaproteobacteria bacterium]|nr:site-specific DNA-methyltransferase [Deltaproteobacteria bacterium]HCH65511.1 site-specific DNA-methyltransferase [Deltaproteobacteria bacterium]